MKKILTSYLLLILNIAVYSQVSITYKHVEACQGGSNLWDLKYRWNYVENFTHIEDTIILYFGAKEDCGFADDYCTKFFVDKKADSLFIDYETYGGHTDEKGVVHEGCPSTCLCFFKIRMEIITSGEKVNRIIYKDEDLTERNKKYRQVGEISYKIYKEDTINFIDQYGIKSGVWIDFAEDGSIRKEVIYHEDWESGIQTHYSNDGRSKMTILLFKGIPVRTTNYMDGDIISESYFTGKSIDRIDLIRSKTGVLKEVQAFRKADPKIEIIR